MAEEVPDERDLRARFDLFDLDSDGLLLDRESGSIFRLNSTAHQIWTALIANQSIASIITEFTDRFRLSREQARRDVLTALTNLPRVPQKPTVDQYQWRATPDGYDFSENGRVVCAVDPSGDSLRLGEGLRPSEREAWAHLKSVVPKLLALRGIPALHAAAVDIGGSLLVFSGRSGAGKTTSARAFAAAGGRLVSEDLLIVHSSPKTSAGVIGGEPVARDWVAERASQLAADPGRAVDCTGLDRCVRGDRLPIHRIFLLDADRRVGNRIGIEELPRSDAAVALVESAYFASGTADSWRGTLKTVSAIAGSVPTAIVTMPAGLAELQIAARATIPATK